MDDPALLTRYVEARDNSAFTELVQRHLGLVYHTALRRLDGDAHHACDVSQTVFNLLARKAPTLLRHPTLTGWLHASSVNAARDLLRANRRREHREQEVFAMQESSSAASPSTTELWRELRAVIDESLSDLNAADRDALLLRYFEDQPLAHIASTLRLTEDAARMRVNRALEKLRSALIKRGVTSTAAALAATLAPHTALAAPAGLSASISTTTLSLISTGATAATAGAAGVAALKVMTTSKIVSSAAVVLSLGFAVFQTTELSRTRHALADLKNENARLRSQSLAAETSLAEIRRKMAEAEEDTTRMLAAVDTARTTLETTAAKSDEAPITRETVQARFTRARSLAKSGQHEAALQDFLWCFDTGMKQVMGYNGVRATFLLSDVAELGKKYPPALAALRDRRDAAAQTFGKSPSDIEALKDLTSLNHALGEDLRNLALFDSFPPKDTNRNLLAFGVSEQLIEARRYNDLARAMPYSRMSAMFDLSSERIDKTPEAARATLRQHVSTSAAKNIEVLAGAGDFEHAKQLASRVLAFDASPETRELIQKHLTRAGHPDLLAP